MITPARAAVTRQPIFKQPLQSKLSFVLPHLVASRFVKPHEASRQKTHAFDGAFLGNSQHGTQIHRKPSHALLEYCAQEVGLEGKWTHKSGSEAIETYRNRDSHSLPASERVAQWIYRLRPSKQYWNLGSRAAHQQMPS